MVAAVQVAGTIFLAVLWLRADENRSAGSFTVAAVLHADVPPSLERTTRSLDTAVELYRAGRVRTIACVGGNRRAAGLHAGDAMRAYLVARAVPPENVLVERESFDTRSNVHALRMMLGLAGAGPVAIIVYPSHEPRVRHYLRGSGVRAQFLPARAPRSTATLLYDSWISLNHEAVAWAAALMFSDALYAGLMASWREGAL